MTEDERLDLLAAALDQIERTKERLAISEETLARSRRRMAETAPATEDGDRD